MKLHSRKFLFVTCIVIAAIVIVAAFVSLRTSGPTRSPAEPVANGSPTTSSTPAMDPQPAARQTDPLEISLGGSGTYFRGDISIEITFKATGGPVRVLDAFSSAPPQAFFSFDVFDRNGEPVLVRALVVEFGPLPSPLKYVEVSKHKAFKLVVRIDDIFPKYIKPGEYAITADYRNFLGENCNCFKGATRKSAPFRFRIVAEDARP